MIIKSAYHVINHFLLICFWIRGGVSSTRKIFHLAIYSFEQSTYKKNYKVKLLKIIFVFVKDYFSFFSENLCTEMMLTLILNLRRIFNIFYRAFLEVIILEHHIFVIIRFSMFLIFNFFAIFKMASIVWCGLELETLRALLTFGKMKFFRFFLLWAKLTRSLMTEHVGLVFWMLAKRTEKNAWWDYNCWVNQSNMLAKLFNC